MPTPRPLLSFRRSVALLARERAVEEDDGWVHGGKYVPADRRQGRTPPAHGGRANGANGPASAGSGGGVSVGVSPYSMISPGPLDTPLPEESMGAPATGASSHSTRQTPQSGATANSSRGTPQTVQLQRLLEPTPAPERTPQATPTNSIMATPAYGQRGQLVVSPTTPMGKFLLQSGVPAEASNAIGDAATQFYDALFSFAVAAWNVISEWWHKMVASNFPSDIVPDVLETLGEFVADVFRFAWKVAKFLSPFALWALQTLIALSLMIGSGVIWGAIYFIKGSKEEADGSRAGEVQASARKSLKESVLNSPFVKKLPFTGFTDGIADQNATQPAARASSVGAPSASGTSSHRSTPPVSAMRNGGQTPHVSSIGSSRKSTPATARRVLFSETEAGLVATEQFCYDKHLPASARKEAHRKTEEQSSAGGEMEAAAAAASPAASSGLAAASSGTPENANTILRSSKYSESPAGASKSNAQKETVKVSSRQPTPAPKASTQPRATPHPKARKSEEELQQEAERQKQQYIERYGLLPNITPLSQRYAQRKRNQQQQQGKKPVAIGNGPSTTTDSTTNASELGGKRNVGANPKRKRRGDLLGAASRLGRNRRARLGVAGSSLPSVVLNRSAATKRRRDDAGLSATDEWVWRAMNKDGKENRANDLASEASAAKRGKFASSSEAVGTPPKNDPTPTTPPPAMTPPKTPGPSKFSLGSATPAPKKFSTTDAADAATPAKPTPSLPFAFGDASAGDKDSSKGTGGGAFSFAAKTNDGGAGASTSGTAGGAGFAFSTTAPAAKTETKDASVTAAGSGFAFGKTTAVAPEEKKVAAAAPAASSGPAGFAFNASTSATSAPSAGDKKEPASGGFAFSAAAPATSEKKEAASTPAFAFGNTTSASAGSAAPPTAPSFSFGTAAASASGTTTAPASTAPTPAAATAPAPTPGQFTFSSSNEPAPASASGAKFSFGSPSAATATGTATPGATTPATAPFAFGTSAQPTPAGQTKEAAPSGAGFSFGTTATPATGGAAQPSTFAFRARAATTPAAAPTFGGAANSFSIGGGAGTSGGGASARRRAAKASGRRR